MNIITVQDIPYVKATVKSTKQPYQIMCTSKEGYSVLCDGSIIKLFAGKELLIPEMAKMITDMSPGSTIQIYKHHHENDQFYIAIQKQIDYKFLKRQWKKTFSEIFNGPRIAIGELRAATTRAVEAIDRIAPPSFREIDMMDNDIIRYLYKGKKLVSNLSLIRSDESTFATTVSINNIATIPTVSNIIRSFDYLCVITLARSEIKFEREIKRDAADMAHLISSLSEENKSNIAQVHTMQNATEYVQTLAGAVSYINVKYILQANDLDELNNNTERFCSALNSHGIVVYKPSISGLNEYVAAFPGNGLYGEHYYQIVQQMGAVLINRVNSL